MSDHRFITATFCDDIRHEVGNKFSLVGCYTGEMITEMLPVALPKFCASIAVHSRISNPFKKLSVKALLNDVLIAEQEIPEGAILIEDQLSSFKKADFITKFSINIQFVFSPFLVEADSWLSIVAETEDGLIQGPYFHIRSRQESDGVINNFSNIHPTA